MSTTFGVNTTGFKDFELVDDEVPYWLNKDIFEEVAFRSSNGIRFTNPLGVGLSDDTKVYALNNTQQGIFTIGDIKKEILEQSKQ